MNKMLVIFCVGVLGFAMNIFAMGEDPQTSGHSDSPCCETCFMKNAKYAATNANCAPRFATPRKDSAAVSGAKRFGGKSKKASAM